MLLKVKKMDGEMFTVDLFDGVDTKISAVKAKVLSAIDVAVDRQRLIYCGRVLKDNQTLSDYSITEDSVVHIVIRPDNVPASNPTPPSTTSQTTPPAMPAPLPRGVHVQTLGNGVMVGSMTIDSSEVGSNGMPPEIQAIVNQMMSVAQQGLSPQSQPPPPQPSGANDANESDTGANSGSNSTSPMESNSMPQSGPTIDSSVPAQPQQSHTQMPPPQGQPQPQPQYLHTQPQHRVRVHHTHHTAHTGGSTEMSASNDIVMGTSHLHALSSLLPGAAYQQQQHNPYENSTQSLALSLATLQRAMSDVNEALQPLVGNLQQAHENRSTGVNTIEPHEVVSAQTQALNISAMLSHMSAACGHLANSVRGINAQEVFCPALTGRPSPPSTTQTAWAQTSSLNHPTNTVPNMMHPQQQPMHDQHGANVVRGGTTMIRQGRGGGRIMVRQGRGGGRHVVVRHFAPHPQQQHSGATTTSQVNAPVSSASSRPSGQEQTSGQVEAMNMDPRSISSSQTAAGPLRGDDSNPSTGVSRPTDSDVGVLSETEMTTVSSTVPEPGRDSARGSEILCLDDILEDINVDDENA